MIARIAFATGMLLAAATTQAATVNFASTSSIENVGSFTGSADYNSLTGILTISLKNTSASTNFITGFVFNYAATGVSSIALSPSPQNNFTAISNVTASGFPSPPNPFAVGAALGGDWDGGGTPNDGIANNVTKSFNFTVTPDGSHTIASFTTAGFFPFPDGDFIAVRTRGGDPGTKSDKILGATIPSTGATPTPLPSAVLGVPAMLAGFAGIKRLRKKN